MLAYHWANTCTMIFRACSDHCKWLHWIPAFAGMTDQGEQSEKKLNAVGAEFGFGGGSDVVEQLIHFGVSEGAFVVGDN